MTEEAKTRWAQEVLVVIQDELAVRQETQVANLLAHHSVSSSSDFGRRTWAWNTSPMHSAAFRGRADIVRLLAKAGVAVDAYEIDEDEDNVTTPLHDAIVRKNVSTVAALLNLGADTRLTGKFGKVKGNAMDFALFSANEEVIKMLQDHDRVKQNMAKRLYLNVRDDLMTKDSKEKELQEAIVVSCKISELTTRWKELNAEAKEVQGQISELKRSEGYRDEIQVAFLRQELAEMDELISFVRGQTTSEEKEPKEKKNKSLEKEEEGAEEFSDDVVCPVCLTLCEHEIFGCRKCHTNLCGKCHANLSQCPSCRVGFEEFAPARNGRAEQMALKIARIMARLSDSTGDQKTESPK